jgi:hypothetical protein
MDESPNPGENEEPGARLGRIPPSGCKKRLPGAKSGGWLEMLLEHDLIRLALKSQIQAPKLVFYGRKIDDGDHCPYSQPVKQNILFYRLQIRALVAATCALTRKIGF